VKRFTPAAGKEQDFLFRFLASQRQKSKQRRKTTMLAAGEKSPRKRKS